ncbi:hypothetical protein GEMRC1_003487 [Eukaryota sp. GEM-RC1]
MDRPHYNSKVLIGNWLEEKANTSCPVKQAPSSFAHCFNTTYGRCFSENRASRPQSSSSTQSFDPFATTSSLSYKNPSTIPPKMENVVAPSSVNVEQYRQTYSKCPASCVSRFVSTSHRDYGCFTKTRK